MARKVLIACKVDSILVNRLNDLGYEAEPAEKISRQYALDNVSQYEGIITSTRLTLDRELLERATMLKWIGRMGSGMEIIDTEYAAIRCIRCFSSPDGNCNSVGEHVLGMLLALTRNIVTGHNQMVGGIWQRDQNRGIELEGRTIGIIGYGHAGAAFARKLSGFNVKIVAYDKYNPENIVAPVIRCDSIDEILAQAEIVSFHVPLQADTEHYFNEDFVARMKKPFVLINASRGGVVDIAAVHRGLLSGKITGACLDVFEDEPPFQSGTKTAPIIAELAQMPQVILTPHIAGYSYEAIRKMSVSLASQIV